MSQPNKKYTIITATEYFMMQERNQPYQGYIVYPDGEVTYALSEVVVKSTPSDLSVNRFTQFALIPEMKYHESPTPYICETDNIYVDRESLVLKMKANNENYFIRRQVKDALLNSVMLSFQTQNQTKIEIDGQNPKGGTQIAFAKLKSKIEDETIKREDLYKYEHLRYNSRKEIDAYFACFDPKDSNYRQFWNISSMPTGVETYIPVWGNFKMAEEYFQRGWEGNGGWNYCYGIGNFLFGVADGVSLGMITGIGAATQAFGPLKSCPIQRAYFPTIRGGYGIFGKEGLKVRGYKVEAMYQYSKESSGGGTILSIRQKPGVNLFRIDYGSHNYGEPFSLHYHLRYMLWGQKHGSTNPNLLIYF